MARRTIFDHGPPAQARDPDRPATYSVSLWDHEAQAWVPEWTGLSKWGMRGAIRAAEARGYSSMSYLVEREG